VRPCLTGLGSYQNPPPMWNRYTWSPNTSASGLGSGLGYRRSGKRRVMASRNAPDCDSDARARQGHPGHFHSRNRKLGTTLRYRCRIPRRIVDFVGKLGMKVRFTPLMRCWNSGIVRWENKCRADRSRAAHGVMRKVLHFAPIIKYVRCGTRIVLRGTYDWRTGIPHSVDTIPRAEQPPGRNTDHELVASAARDNISEKPVYNNVVRMHERRNAASSTARPWAWDHAWMLTQMVSQQTIHPARERMKSP
jgi:hypothetical protein